ncbi:MAG TPA: TrkA family potassium uptake protein [Actinomycetota bacterium]|nr:TrkA family potassium uptake protein [Actinomycetota bacterium]
MFAIIVGGGKVGESLAAALLDEGQEVVLLEQDRSRHAVLLQRFPEAALYGDGTEVRTLRDAGAERADALVAATGEDQVNLVVSEVSAKLFKVANVVARVNDPKNFDLFRRAGVEHPVSSTHLLMATIHQEVEPGDLFRLASLRRSSLEIVEVFIPDGAPCVGCSVSDIPMPSESLLMALQRNGRWSHVDRADQVRPGDVVLALTPVGGEGPLRESLCGR